MVEKRQALGRGLSALIPEAIASGPAPAPPRPSGKPIDVDLDLLRPNHFQPRVHMDDQRLDELAQSIRANGVIQPIVARRREGGYEIITGERRWRAAQRAGVLRVPVVVRDVPDEKLLETALIENIQREDLNAVEEARAYQRLATEFKMTQEQIATAVGKERSTIANVLRLLKLPDDVVTQLSRGDLTMGHARALLGIEDAAALRRAAREVVDRKLSVRDTELLVRRLTSPRSSRGRDAREVDANTRAAEEKLRFALGTRVRIARKGAGGRLEIEFKDEEELQRLYELLTGE
ncbi:MAG TPA: ParB/RepB/Spo0J family partition protein [Vicinamibacterales bacterium]|nr:ParB/RepB/Spo0J family partition protein [Vicinamibacterales bacterium]